MIWRNYHLGMLVYTVSLLILPAFFVCAQIPEKTVRELFDKLPVDPTVLPLKNPLPFSEQGGHIQGIQLVPAVRGFSAYLSGSSRDVAYVAQVDLMGEAKVNAIDTLLLSPYRHAGGFQIFGGYLAVGIEDNQLRTSSKVIIYGLETSKDWEKPLYIIERKGPFERSTAGAVGITKYKDEIILVVADWNSRHLDVYSCARHHFQNTQGYFAQIASLEVRSLNKSSWSDSTWHSYQNINLLADQTGLYAIAFARDAADQQVADLFEIRFEGDSGTKFHSPVATTSIGTLHQGEEINSFYPRNMSLRKLSSKVFTCREGADFKAAGGVYHKGNELIISMSPYQLSGNQSINLFGIDPQDPRIAH